MVSPTRLLAGSVSFAVLVGILFTAQPAFASIYEWITGLTIGHNGSTAGELVTMSWTVHTSAPYDEYRSLYYSTSSSPFAWQEFPGCEHSGSVTSTITEGCDVNMPEPGTELTPYGASSTFRLLWIRASTNYANCVPGLKYTPTPDEMNCGGTQTSSTYVAPSM